MWLRVLFVLLMLEIHLRGQGTRYNFITLPVPPVNYGFASVVGEPGSVTSYYWIIAKYTGGDAAPYGPITVSNMPPLARLGLFQYSVISWDAVSGATSYDVLRTTSPLTPSGACNCAVVTGTAATSVNDQSSALNAYTVDTSGIAYSHIEINNRDYTPPKMTLTVNGTTALVGGDSLTFDAPLTRAVNTISLSLRTGGALSNSSGLGLQTCPNGNAIINTGGVAGGWGCWANPGTVTSVAATVPGELSVSGSPILTTGTFAFSWANQTTNKFFMSPNGSTGTPTFRAVATADLGTGTASASTFLRGDLTWGAPEAVGINLPAVTFSGSVITVCGTCATTPANVRFGNTVNTYSASGTMTLTTASGADTVKLFAINGGLKAQYNAAVITAATFGGSGLTGDTAGTSLPAGAVYLGTCTTSGTSVTACTDLRGAGTIVPTSTGGSCTITLTATGYDWVCPGTVSGTGAVKTTAGTLGLVSGTASDCVKVDGSSGACGGSSTTIEHFSAGGCSWSGSPLQGNISLVGFAADPLGCVGTNYLKVRVGFPASVTTARIQFRYPVGASEAATATIRMQHYGFTAGTVSFMLASACLAAGGGTVDPTFTNHTAQTAVVDATGNMGPLITWSAITPTACAAHNIRIWQITRDDNLAFGHYFMEASVTR